MTYRFWKRFGGIFWDGDERYGSERYGDGKCSIRNGRGDELLQFALVIEKKTQCVGVKLMNSKEVAKEMKTNFAENWTWFTFPKTN